MENKTVIFSALDWGLGHTIRSISLIRQYQQKNYKIFFAGTPEQITILKNYFTDIIFFQLNGYTIYYNKNNQNFLWVIVKQLPKIVSTIIHEYFWLKKFLKSQNVDLIISDNRYGFFSAKIPSILVTHQLNIILYNPFLKRLLAFCLHNFIRYNFSEVWVPDFEEEAKNLSGQLALPIPSSLRNKTKFIGWLSRYDFSIIHTTEVKFKIIFILSGPEPQRTYLENKILEEVKKYSKQKFCLIRGLNSQAEIANKLDNLETHNYLSSPELWEKITVSEIVLGRSGYTSVMELISLNKKLVFVPTPQQSEQEYLAKYLLKFSQCQTIGQHDFSLSQILSNKEPL